MALVLALALTLLILVPDMPRRKTASVSAHDRDAAELALMKTLRPHAAGIDLGTRQHWVCVPEGSVPDRSHGPHRQTLPGHVRCFGTTTPDLRRLVEWLRQAKVTTVAMEATGVYWIAVYDLLEAEGFEVLLVDPHKVKAAPGRPKTDVKDCMWIQRLHSLGLLSAAFRPEESVRVLRSYQRQRQTLVEDQSRFVLRIQKALEQMNVKLTEVVSQVLGKTGWSIIEAILAGQRDPKELAKLRQRGCKHSSAAIAAALEGTWQEEHLFSLKQAVEMYECYQAKIADCDRRIEEQLKKMARPEKSRELPAGGKRKGGNNSLNFEARQALYDLAGVDLTAIEGVGMNTAMVVLSEVGTDMSRWRSEKAFGAWLGLAPNPRKTGGKLKSARTRPGVNRAAQALRLAARTLQRSKSALGAFFRRIASRRGYPKAITATAYKLARIIYRMLKHGEEYTQQSLAEYEQAYQQKQLKNLKKRAAELGYELKEKEEAKLS